MPAMPPQGPAPAQGAPQGAPQPPQAGPAPGAPKPGGDAPMSAQQSILMAYKGLQGLGKVLSGAPEGMLEPQDKQLFNDVVTGFQALVSKLGNGQGESPAPGGNQKAPPSGAPMMSEHANAGAKPSF